MAYTPKQWKDGDVITKEALNNIEQGIVNVPAGPKGDTGAAGAKGATGKGVKGIALTTTDGKVTGGTVTFDDDSTGAVTVTEA
ncbi:hypothetical protein OGZ51_09595 [Lactococcus lactis]|uniref:Uncharacterized protein n=1 Tax=Lactococcus lactis TaxID=1358 RepID=A0A9X4S729_9LACT|nr:hypothetical protein [Lactococcus lactis]MDG4984396.1 hypothetical protein [Lactococcus lactis]